MTFAIYLRGVARRHPLEMAVRGVLFLCAALAILTTAGIIAVVAEGAVGFFAQVSPWEFLTGTRWTPLFEEKHFGILPLLAGTVITSGIALLFAGPMGLVIAVYLSEFATARARRRIKPLLEILAGIPTVVYGYFALLFVTPALRLVIPGLAGFNALAPGIVMGVMILPMIASLSEDALYAVPRSLVEGSLALGATRLATAFRVVIPAAFSGISAAFLLSLSRALGETMIVAIAAGQQTELSLDPTGPMQTMTAYIAQVSLGDVPHGTLEYGTIFAVAAALFLLTAAANGLGFRLRRGVREAYES